MRHRVISISLASVFVAAGVGLAQVGEPAASQPGDDGSIVPRIVTTSSTAPATGPGGGGTATMGSAESVLQNLLREKGTLGTGGTGGADNPSVISTTGPALGADGLLREGQQLQVRSGHLKKDETGNSIFVFDDRQQPHYPAMGVVPSRRLERMEDVAFADGHSGADTTFVIDAEVTQFRGKNYLYIGRTPFGMPKRTATTSTPATATATASAPASMAALVDVPAPDMPAAVLLAETTVIAGRDVRFVKDLKTGTELLTFFADGRKMFDPPMGLIPCKMLAYLEDQTELGNKPVRFRVSGEVTMYRGKNYLYLRTAWEVPDLSQGIGNFDPATGNKPVPARPVKPG